MTKEQLIELLSEHAKKAGVFGNRFVSVTSDNNRWVYHRPAVDCLEPSIDLSTEGLVLYKPNVGFGDNTIKEISYEDFVTKYNLERE